MTETTLYEKLGGREAVDATVDRFYERVLDDDRLAGFFDDTDVDELRDHQRTFITYVTGGADAYDGRSMREAHADLGITEADFAAVADHLRTTLDELGVPKEHADAVMAAVAELEDDIVTT